MNYSFRQITKKDYPKILKLDKKVYPTSKPVTQKILSIWYSKNPEFGVVLEKGRKVAGYLISIPLSKEGSEKLISGKLAEAEMTDKHIFDSKRDEFVYIHIYHIEKFIPDRGITELMLKELMQNTKFKINRLSAYCVTLAGIDIFEKLGFKEGKYISMEHIMKRGNKLFVFELNNKQMNQKIKEEYTPVTRCKMLVCQTPKQ